MIQIDPNNVASGLAAAKLDSRQYVNWFTGRWPYISFLGGMAMGNRSEDLEFFYQRAVPVAQHGAGLRARRRREGLRPACQVTTATKEAPPKPSRSFLLRIRTDVLLAEYHPSYILANGRRVWDFKKHKMGADSILVPFSVEEASDVTIDLVVDRDTRPIPRAWPSACSS